MENAAEALKMAAAMLIFILALTIAIVFFGRVREVSDLILNIKDRETEYVDGDYYYSLDSKNERIVGMETIIPTIYRAYLENYKVTFKFNSEYADPIYSLQLTNGENIKKYSLDLETNNNLKPMYRNVVLGNDNQKKEFLVGILYHRFIISKENFENKYNVKLGDKSLYDRIKGKKFEESLGVYYQDDSTNTPEVMKVEKRIINYDEQ